MARKRESTYTPEEARKPLPGLKIDRSEIVRAIHDCRGIMAHAADQIGCSRRALCQIVDGDEELKKELEDARERRIDEVERAAYQRAKDLSCPGTQRFILSTLGRNRGYAPAPSSPSTAISSLADALDWVARHGE